MMLNSYMYNYSPECDAFFAPSASFCAHFDDIAHLNSTASSAVLFFVISILNVIRNTADRIIRDIHIIKTLI